MVVSIFYNRSSWHKLLTDLIKPFIEQEQANLQAYYIYFNTNQGDEVTLAMPSNDSDLEKKFSLKAERFLFSNASETRSVVYPLQSFFMDYPNNSFCYNKDKFLVNSLNNHALKLTEQKISDAMIGALRDEIDVESIYTFIVYMQLGIIKAKYNNVKQARIGVANLLQYISIKEDRENNKIDVGVEIPEMLTPYRGY